MTLEYGVLSFSLPLGSLWSDRLHRYPWGQSELLLLQAASSVCGWKMCDLLPESSLLIYSTQQRLNTWLMLCNRNLEAKMVYVVQWSMFGTSENIYTASVTGFMVHRCGSELNFVYNVYFWLASPIFIRICYMILETKHTCREELYDINYNLHHSRKLKNCILVME